MTLFQSKGIELFTGTDITEINKHGNQLSKLKRIAPDELLLMMSVEIEKLYSMVNVKRRMDEPGVVAFCQKLISEKYYLKFEEFQYILNRGVMCHYGKILDRLDAAVLFDWIRQFEMSGELILSWELSRDERKKKEAERNISVLEMPGFKKMVGSKIENPKDDEDKYKKERDKYLSKVDKSQWT